MRGCNWRQCLQQLRTHWRRFLECRVNVQVEVLGSCHGRAIRLRHHGVQVHALCAKLHNLRRHHNLIASLALAEVAHVALNGVEGAPGGEILRIEANRAEELVHRLA